MQSTGSSPSYLVKLLSSAFLVLGVSSLLAWYLDDGSLFSILLLYTLFLSLKVPPRIAGILASGFILYTVFFMLVPLRRELTVEVLFVAVIWLTASVLPSRMMELYRRRTINEEYYRALLEASPGAIITLDTQNRIEEWNNGAVALFHYSRDEVLGRNIDELLTSGDRSAYESAQELTSRVAQGFSITPTERIRYTREGDPVHVLIAGAPVFINGEFRGVAASYTDIDKRKQAEDEVQRMLNEKEQLLKEVHHRIKNHMNTISAILNLQIQQHSDGPAARELEEINNRILIMQNIYQNLYLSEDIDSVNAKSLVDHIIRDIENSSLFDDSISITAHLTEVHVTARQSLPVGIIVNELITNALKYAFAGRESGRINVAMGPAGEDALQIEVKDNGIGLPEEVEKEGKFGFGLTIVEGYAEQYRGSFMATTEAGTRMTIVMKLEKLESENSGLPD